MCTTWTIRAEGAAHPEHQAKPKESFLQPFFFNLVKVLSSTFYLGNEKQSRAPSKFGEGLRALFLLFVHISFLVVVSTDDFLNLLPKHGK